MSVLRKWGRGVLLPVKKIERLIDIFYNKFCNDDPILDFGSGTLFYSEKFALKYNKKVFAVDPIYAKKEPNLTDSHITLCKDISDTKNIRRFSMVFSCDVLHHVDKNDMEKYLEDFSRRSNLIIIKDIEATDFLGNLQNKVHDLIFSWELVNNIYSKKIAEFYLKRGFRTKTYYMKRFGYPHFLLIAYKK